MAARARTSGPEARTALAAVAFAIMGAVGCGRSEAPEATLARSSAAFRRAQIANLEALIAKAEKGEVVTSDQIAIGISEDVMKSVLGASLPREVVVADRLRVRIESAVPVFRGSVAGLVFRATASSLDVDGASATLEIGGTLEKFQFENGRLLSRVALAHFTVLESSVGDLASDALQHLVQSNSALIQDVIPPLEIPVQIEQSIKIGGLTSGAVVAKPGALPLEITVSQVLPINQRLWILLKAKAGPWKPGS